MWVSAFPPTLCRNRGQTDTISRLSAETNQEQDKQKVFNFHRLPFNRASKDFCMASIFLFKLSTCFINLAFWFFISDTETAPIFKSLLFIVVVWSGLVRHCTAHVAHVAHDVGDYFAEIVPNTFKWPLSEAVFGWSRYSATSFSSKIALSVEVAIYLHLFVGGCSGRQNTSRNFDSHKIREIRYHFFGRYSGRNCDERKQQPGQHFSFF